MPIFFVILSLILGVGCEKKINSSIEQKKIISNPSVVHGVTFLSREGGSDGVLAKIQDKEITLQTLFPNKNSGYEAFVEQEKEEFIRFSYFFFKKTAREKNKILKGTIKFLFDKPQKKTEEIISDDFRKNKIILLFDKAKKNESHFAEWEEEKIDINQIKKMSFRYHDIKMREFQFIKDQLAALYIREGLFKLAQEKKMNTDEYLKSELMVSGESQDLSDEEWDEYLKNKQIKLDDLTDDLKLKIKVLALKEKQQVEGNKLISKKLKDQPLELYIKEPSPNLEVNHEWTLFSGFSGSEQADEELYLFTNFTCESCRKMENVLKSIVVKSKGKIKIGRIPLLSASDYTSHEQTELSVCIYKYDPQNFTAYIDKMYEGDQSPNLSELKDWFTSRKGKWDEINKCRDTHELKPVVQSYRDYTELIGLSNQPILIKNKSVLLGLLDQIEDSSLLAKKSDGGPTKNKEESGEKLSLWRRILLFIRSLF